MSFARRLRERVVRGAYSHLGQRRLAGIRRNAVRASTTRRLRDGGSSPVEWLETRNLLAVLHVSLTGDDGNDGSVGAPLRSIQAAITAAAAAADGSDHILVAGGIYDNVALDGPLEIADDAELETLLIEGGYAADFLSRDLINSPTVYAPQSGTTGITLGDADTTIDGFQLTATGFDIGVGISADGATLRDVAVTGGALGVAAQLVEAPALLRVHVSQTTDAGFAFDQLTGPLVLDSLSAVDNEGDGLRATSLTGSCTIQAGTYSDNGGDSLSFTNVQMVTVSGVTASGNARGLVIDTAVGVAITNGDFTNNIDAAIFLTHVTLPGVVMTGVQASATGGVAFKVVDAIGVQLTDVQFTSSAPHPGAVLEGVSFFAYVASSAPENDALSFRNGVLTHKRDNLLRASVQIELPAAISINGGAGNDTLSIGTGSGYQDIVDITTGSVTMRRGPEPLDAPLEVVGYDSVETLSVSTEGGADTISVNLAATGFLPAIISIHGDDENDGVEINHSPMNRAVTINLDGGGGTNGLTTFTRSAERDRVTIYPAAIAVRLGPTSPVRPDQTTNFSNIHGLAVFAGDGDDTIEVRMGGTADGVPIRVDAGGGNNDDLRVLTESGYEDIVRVDNLAVSVQFGPTPQLARMRVVPYSGVEIVELFTAGGNDTITIAEPAEGNLPRGVAISGQDEDDYIRLIAGNRIAQSAFLIDGGGGSANKFEVFTASGYDDIVTMDGLSLAVQVGPDPSSAPIKAVSLANIQIATIRTAGGADSVTVTPASSGSFVQQLNIQTEDEADSIFINQGVSALTTAFHSDGGNSDGDTLTINDIPGTNGYLEVDSVAAPGVFGAQNLELVILLGSTGNDTLINKTAITAFLNGGPGNDTLTGGSGFDILLGGAGNDLMHGGGGIDVLLASSGNDSLFGDAGRDLLIGGPGGDFFDGGSEDDILIAGSTSFDDQQFALDAILGEWAAFRAYQARVDNLSGTGTGPRLNGDVFLLAGVTVFEDTSDIDIDTLTGGGGNDFFFLNLDEDILADLADVEVTVDVTQGM